MDLALSSDQRAIQDAFAALFARESTSERVRAAERDGLDRGLWRLLADLGAIGIAVADELGGAGAGLVELALVAEEWGARVACAPLVEAATAARALAAHREDAVARDLLERALRGEAVVVLAPRAASGGVAPAIPGGAVADAVVALDGTELVAVESAPPGGPGDLAFLAVADRRLRDANARRTVLAEGPAATAAWAQARAEWLAAAAAALAGLSREALELGVRYAVERRQFGVAIGAFQALQQRFADAVTATDGAQLVAREAAWRMDHAHATGRELATIAFAHAARSARQAAELTLHVHGGYGYTLEYDAQLYLRRAAGLGLAAGDPDALWEEVGAASLARAAA